MIKFKEITNKLKQNPRKYNGKIYIDAENYALKKLETAVKNKTKEAEPSFGNRLTINGFWFLKT